MDNYELKIDGKTYTAKFEDFVSEKTAKINSSKGIKTFGKLAKTMKGIPANIHAAWYKYRMDKFMDLKTPNKQVELIRIKNRIQEEKNKIISRLEEKATELNKRIWETQELIKSGKVEGKEEKLRDEIIDLTTEFNSVANELSGIKETNENNLGNIKNTKLINLYNDYQTKQGLLEAENQDIVNEKPTVENIVPKETDIVTPTFGVAELQEEAPIVEPKIETNEQKSTNNNISSQIETDTIESIVDEVQDMMKEKMTVGGVEMKEENNIVNPTLGVAELQEEQSVVEPIMEKNGQEPVDSDTVSPMVEEPQNVASEPETFGKLEYEGNQYEGFAYPMNGETTTSKDDASEDLVPVHHETLEVDSDSYQEQTDIKSESTLEFTSYETTEAAADLINKCKEDTKNLTDIVIGSYIGMFNQINDFYKGQFDTLTRRYDETVSNNSVLQENLASAKDSNAELAQRLEKQAESIKNDYTPNVDVENMRTAYETRVSGLEAQNRELKRGKENDARQYKLLDQNYQNSIEKLKASQQENSALQQRLSQSNQVNQQLTMELQSKDSQVSQLTSGLHAKDDEISDLKANINANYVPKSVYEKLQAQYNELRDMASTLSSYFQTTESQSLSQEANEVEQRRASF